MEKTYTVYATGFPKPSLFIRKGEYSPDKYIFIRTVTCEPSKINKIAEGIFYEEMRAFKKDPTPATHIEIGDVVTHSDGKGKAHRGVVLDIEGNRALLVFCTTNKDWNKKARIATEEERKLFCFKSKTYIAPVVKDLRDLYKIGYSFPQYRIEEFIEEFGKC